MASPTRRERVRAATVEEITRTARRLLAAEGPGAISLRAIARDMGMTAPALYRYFPSHEALLEHLCAELGNELVGELEQARDAAPAGQIGTRLRAACRAFRGWAIGHPAEFTLMFASTRQDSRTPPLHGWCIGDPPGAEAVAAMRFARVFLDLIVELWRRRRFPVIEPEVFPDELRRQLEEFVRVGGLDVPIGLAYVFLTGWVRLYGLVALEVFGHLSFAINDVEPLFEAEISAMAAQFDLALEG